MMQEGKINDFFEQPGVDCQTDRKWEETEQNSTQNLKDRNCDN